MTEFGFGVLLAFGAFYWDGWQSPDTFNGRVRTPVQDQLEKLFMIIQLLAGTITAMQATWLPTLMRSYGYGNDEVRTFDLVMLYASIVSGFFLAPYIDDVGRRKGMQAWAAMSLGAVVLATDSSMPSLILAQILSGIAMGFLGSSFEAWFLSQYGQSDSVAQVFAICIAWSGLALVLSQLVGFYATQLFGPIGPIYISGLALLTSLVIISANCSENHGNPKKGSDSKWHLMSALKALVGGDMRLKALAISQSLTDGAVAIITMHWFRIFGFQEVNSRASIRTYFLVYTSIGALIFSRISERRRAILESVASWATIAAALVLVLIVYLPQTWAKTGALFLFHIALGVYWPNQATLRAKYVPEEERAGVLGLLNISGAATQIVVICNESWFHGDAILWAGAALLTLASLCQQAYLLTTVPKYEAIIAMDAEEIATA